MKLLFRVVAAVLLALLVAVLAIWLKFGFGDSAADLTADPVLPTEALEEVVALDYPPGNVAVAADGRVFFTLHPDGEPPEKVYELVDGSPHPYPDMAFQHKRKQGPFFDTVLSLRIDRQNRLWTLDFARFGRGIPRLLAFDLATGRVVHEYRFPAKIAGFGSMVNDFQVDPDGKHIYIAETSPLVHHPALIVYDIEAHKSRRLLDRDRSVIAHNFVIHAPGRDMLLYGIYNLRIGVDSIALDRNGEWLYYGPVSGDRLYRIRTRDLNNAELDDATLSARVEDFARKPLTDGLTTDVDGNIYLTDMEHSAILRLGQDRQLTTLLKDPRLRWPDGLSFAPGGWLYVTCSSLQHVLFVPKSRMRAHAPYQIFRFQPGIAGVAGQ